LTLITNCYGSLLRAVTPRGRRYMAGKQKKRPMHLPRTPEQIEAVRQRIKEQTEAYQRMKQEQRPAKSFTRRRERHDPIEPPPKQERI
jgi:hypothetical protein